jgi:hypothetical protein
MLAVDVFDGASDGTLVLPRVVWAQAETSKTSSIAVALRILSLLLPMGEVICVPSFAY